MRRLLGLTTLPGRNSFALQVGYRLGTSVAGTFYSESDTAAGASMNNDMRLGIVIKPQSTLVDLWEQAVKAWPMRRFLGAKVWVRGQLGYVWATYESIEQEASVMRTLLNQMGVGKGGRVVVISENRYEWVVVHLASLQLGAQFVVLPTNVTPKEAELVLKSTQARVLFVESTSAYTAVKGWVGEVGQLQHIICFEDQIGEGSYAVAISIASDVPEKTPARKDVTSEDTAMIMFSAGTTGPPKGVMLSHKNLVANVSSIYAHVGEAITHTDMFMSLCSWCVAGALTTELYQAICKGACVCIPPEQLEGFQDLPLVQPSVIVTVAQPFQRAYANIVDNIMNRSTLTKDLTRFTLGRITENRLMMQKPGSILRTASNIFLGKFKAQFGSELRIAFIIGSQLTRDQMELLADLDVFTVSTYGCLEAGGLIATDLDVPLRLKALPGVEIRVVNDKNEIVAPGYVGEVLIEAPHAMQGYFDVHIDPEEAKNSLVAYGGRTFVRTGDYGSMTGGWLTIKGNKDILIRLQNGTVVDPLEVEGTLIKSPFIKQIFVYGEGRPYLCALVVPNAKAIASHLRKVERRDGVPIVSEREKADCIRAELRRVSQGLPTRSHVRRFAFIEELTLANGFITCKYGFARQRVERHYVHYFDAMYDETPLFFGHAVDDYDDLF
ncbi:long-chain-fatty-acid-CoA ligase, putative [Trypanosoma equiperdum]|uniref:Long-chain-fatty acid-CoA ligase protein, putative n=4 Tax=Trypanozoon TaxID=39700 RepID=Q385W8_TRYB2|nr:long-chain-fatty-acid--CoA ligase [Trypanosoma brucei brucei TREU927]EAN79413.1 long-chain-fatty acid-CoA ligase protein, putative [Trypanosoma brucei brucei TREU927]RHW67115.1 long-chain-fatty-acid-CoA ligase [Trypanosoma brucei equiperdum]SCU70024.1 long-chain-fatty-acid-CoA ligase, putative [Trypanosoma equiperdum]